MNRFIGGSLIITIVFLVVLIYSFKEKAKSDFDIWPHIQPKVVPDSISFASESVPLHYFDVYESLDREIQVNSFFHSQTLFYLKRSTRFFPIIEPILKKNNIPDDFKYLAVAESGLANVVSPSDAAGFWQLLKPTAIELGLEVNDKIDERFNLEKSTEVACVYLKKQYDRYGSWTLAAASYNIGPNGLYRVIEAQKQKEYYNLLFNEETARYLFRILAIKTIIEHPEKYGFILDKNDFYPPITPVELEIDSTISNLASWADTHQTNYKIIKYLNPWMRDIELPNPKRKKYLIKVPSNDMRVVLYDELNYSKK